MTFIQKPSANGSVELWNLKRLQWVGDLTRDYFVVKGRLLHPVSPEADLGLG